MTAEQESIVAAIRQLREQVRWKPGKDVAHLSKRIALGHLAFGATVADYEALILRAVSTPDADVFVYRWGSATYPTVIAEVAGVRWLVMMNLAGIMETAFPPEEPDVYLANPQFQRLVVRPDSFDG
jgi:hypothetical protein